jgi:TRAP-type C4-dicarboxylate transport system substrate-binding protein
VRAIVGPGGRLCAVLLLVAVVASPVAAAEPVLIKMGTLAPDGSSWHQIFKAMGEEWRKAPGGGVTLRIYPGGVLGDEPDLVRKMRVGQIQAAALTAVGLADIDTAVSALQIPMMFRSWEEVDAVREQIRPALERRLEEKGFIVLNWGDAGWVMFFAKQPFTTPADMKKLKLFVWAGDNQAIDMWKSAGYQPVPLSSTDILTGLQTGLINAFDTTPLLALSSQWFGLAKHMLDLKWAPLLGATIIHKKTWDKIPAETREAMRHAAAEAGERLKADIRAANDKAIDAMKERGLTVHASSPEIEAAWTREAEGIYPKIRGTLIPAETFDEVKRLRDAYRASAAAGKGAPR